MAMEVTTDGVHDFKAFTELDDSRHKAIADIYDGAYDSSSSCHA
jgi:tRNA U38,U39,U40 pseudouridine synthase TruA